MSNEREGLRDRIAEELKAAVADDFATPTKAFHRLADRILSLLTQAQEPVGYVVVNMSLLGQDRISLPYPGTLYRERDLAQKNADLRNDQEKAFNGTATYTVEPVGASPVASAPEPYERTNEWHEAIQIVDGVLYSIREGTGSAVTADELRTIRNVLLQRASAPEEEREALRISKDMVAFLRASQNRTTSDDPVYVRTPTEEQER